jgi:hypothetical protein
VPGLGSHRLLRPAGPCPVRVADLACLSVDAFVYLRVRPGTLEDVVVQLENVGGVRAAVAVVGAWDVLAAVQGPDLLGISEEVVRGIHLIESSGR